MPENALDEKTLADIYNASTGLHYGEVPEGDKLVLRLWDGMDGCWCDVQKGTRLEVLRAWYEKTDGGTKRSNFRDIDYYRIFPPDTQMHWSGEREMFR